MKQSNMSNLSSLGEDVWKSGARERERNILILNLFAPSSPTPKQKKKPNFVGSVIPGL